ncbi:hypothetical protein LHGZ1_1460 [Laribacter hongkongensis]|uniref:Uncharacterized protein n=1 Tax=Laribacter hongkongensis TaxID=168471 RepID=A0A248LFN6_9NEIS|nr:hypothetical protein LHGZ1_0448 [Laribacter hongkongensis]ASJ24291.1 hypothetical protein LHGZ1_1460 [Laribacter hongkongensis]
MAPGPDWSESGQYRYPVSSMPVRWIQWITSQAILIAWDE